MNLAVVYLASPRLWRHQKWTRIDCLCASLKLLKLNSPAWPVIIFHEDYQSQDMDRLRAIYPALTFSLVDFSTHKERYKAGYRSERVGTYGYGMMCRFFSGVMQAHPLIQGFTHYMRLDDDSYIQSRLTSGVIGRIAASDYTYRCTFDDPCPSAWSYADEFVRRNGIVVPAGVRRDLAPYTNYHTACLRLWRHPVVVEFIAGIEAQNGCITKGWDDAIIQSIITQMLCPALGLKVHVEDGFCYRHNQHCSHRKSLGHSSLCFDGNEEHHHGDMNCQWGPPLELC